MNNQTAHNCPEYDYLQDCVVEMDDPHALAEAMDEIFETCWEELGIELSATDCLKVPGGTWLDKEYAQYCANHRDDFVTRMRAANNSITVAQAIDVYNVLDVVQILLAIPEGQRIIVNKK